MVKEEQPLFSKDHIPEQIQEIYKKQGIAARDIYYRSELGNKLEEFAKVIDVKILEKWVEEGNKFCDEKNCHWQLRTQRMRDGTKKLKEAAEYWKDKQDDGHYSRYITEEQAAAAMEFAKKNQAKQDAFEASISGKGNTEFIEDD